MLLLVVSALGLGQSAPASTADAQAPLFSPEGYRIDAFRAPVPATVPGAETLDTADAKALIDNVAPVVIDVLPAPPRPPGRAPGSLWLPPARYNLPGSIWLPNVGYGVLSDALDGYFRDALAQATAGDRDHALLIYCLADCWMSWNAAKRAAEYGYRRVYWYPDGTTGWEAAGLPLAASEPRPMSAEDRGAPR